MVKFGPFFEIDNQNKIEFTLFNVFKYMGGRQVLAWEYMRLWAIEWTWHLATTLVYPGVQLYIKISDFFSFG